MEAIQWIEGLAEFRGARSISSPVRHGNGFRFQADGEAYFLRLTPSGSSTAENAKRASLEGWAPPYVAGDARGYVVKWIEGAHPPETLEEKISARELLDRVHQSAAVFSGECSAQAALKNSVARSPLPSPELERWLKEARDLAVAAPWRPLHGDPHPENFLVGADRIYLIDWEFAGQGDKDWDLGYWSFTTGEKPENERVSRYAKVAAVVWALWRGEKGAGVFSRPL